MNENKDIFSRGGYLSRKEYLICILKITGLALAAGAFLVVIFSALIGFGGVLSNFYSNPFIYSGLTAIGLFLTQLLAFAVALGTIYLSFINQFKRLRDITGSITDELPYQATIVVLGMSGMPFSIWTAAFLFIKQGINSSPQTAIPLNQIIPRILKGVKE